MNLLALTWAAMFPLFAMQFCERLGIKDLRVVPPRIGWAHTPMRKEDPDKGNNSEEWFDSVGSCSASVILFLCQDSYSKTSSAQMRQVRQATHRPDIIRGSGEVALWPALCRAVPQVLLAVRSSCRRVHFLCCLPKSALFPDRHEERH